MTTKGQMMTRSTILAGVALLALMGCGTDDGDDGAQDADLVMADFSFEPTQLTAATGEETGFTVRNDGDAAHNITMEEFGINTDVEAGGSADFDVTAEQPGDFAFFCKFHPEQMVGQLTVE
jgi:plastocyanin